MNKIIILVILVIILLCIIGFAFKKVKSDLDNKRAKKEFERGSITGTLNGQPYSLNTATIAEEIYSALHRDCMWGACEYEERVVLALQNTPVQFIPNVSDSYMKNHKLNLQGDLIELLDNSNWLKVRHLFN